MCVTAAWGSSWDGGGAFGGTLGASSSWENDGGYGGGGKGGSKGKGKGGGGKGKGGGKFGGLPSDDQPRFDQLLNLWGTKFSSAEQPMAVSLTLAQDHLNVMSGRGDSNIRSVERKYNVQITIGDLTDQGRRLSITGRPSGIYAAHFQCMNHIVNGQGGY